MTASWTVGDTLENVDTGARRVIIRITPAGAYGTRVSDGPTWHARVTVDGVEVPRGHVADIRRDSMSYPAASFRRVES
jgi:hypothetical protein